MRIAHPSQRHGHGDEDQYREEKCKVAWTRAGGGAENNVAYSGKECWGCDEYATHTEAIGNE